MLYIGSCFVLILVQNPVPMHLLPTMLKLIVWQTKLYWRDLSSVGICWAINRENRLYIRSGVWVYPEVYFFDYHLKVVEPIMSKETVIWSHFILHAQKWMTYNAIMMCAQIIKIASTLVMFQYKIFPNTDNYRLRAS